MCKQGIIDTELSPARAADLEETTDFIRAAIST